MRVIHICQRDDSATGGAARVAVELVRRLPRYGIDSKCLFVYGGQGDLSRDISDRALWLGLESAKDALTQGHRLLELLRNQDADAVHHHDGLSWTHVLTRLGFKGMRYGHAHLDGPQVGAPFRHQFAHWVHCKTYDRLIAVSETTRQAWIGAGFPEKNTTCIPNGVDTSKFYPPSDQDRIEARRELGLPENSRVLLSVGRLHVGMKGTDDFLRVFSHLTPDWWAVIAGTGSDESLLRSLANDLGVAGRVRFCGLVSPPLPCYHAADMLAVTSHYEPFGLMVVEAMACGLPIAAFSTTGGVMELLSRSSAIVCPQRVPGALAKLIQAIDFHSPEVLGTSLAARELAKMEYSWDAASATLAAYYQTTFFHRKKILPT
ncbi:MAG: glycosyltransferase family 4 protein [Verrucomicrobia bacterium]|nr:glycosyltransferase family 4 protein [Verrucomicrobiota bacterium]